MADDDDDADRETVVAIHEETHCTVVASNDDDVDVDCVVMRLNRDDRSDQVMRKVHRAGDCNGVDEVVSRVAAFGMMDDERVVGVAVDKAEVDDGREHVTDIHMMGVGFHVAHCMV